MLSARALRVGIACFTGDFDATMTALDRLHVFCESHPPLPVQSVPVRRAEGWALRVPNPADAGRQLLQDAASIEDEMRGLAPQLAYDALRAGAPAAPQLERMAARCQSRLVTAYAQHGSAKAARDGAALMEAAEEMAAIGALRYCRRGRERCRRGVPLGGTAGLGPSRCRSRPRAARSGPGCDCLRSTASRLPRST